MLQNVHFYYTLNSIFHSSSNSVALALTRLH